MPANNAQQIFAALGSSDKELFWVENSGHVIPREPDRLLVFAKVDEFIHKVQNAAQPV